MRVLKSGNPYDEQPRLESWLFTIAHNLAVDGMRQRQDLSLDEPCGPMPASDDASPFLAAARGEDALRVAAALAVLEPVYREALLLRFQEELSLQEIAGIVGAPVSTVASRIYRGLALLRSHWKGGANAV